MQQLSRRSLLAGTGGALALGAAGCLGRAAPSDQQQNSTDDATTGEESPTVPSGLATTLEYVYSPSDDGNSILRIVRHTSDGSSNRMGLHPTVTNVGDPDWIVYVSGQPTGGNRGGVVATGSFDAPDGDRYTPDGSRAGFERYRVESDGTDTERVFATDGETLLLGSADWVAATLDHHQAGDEALVAGTDGVRPLLSELEFTQQSVVVTGDEAIRQPFERADVDTSLLPDVLAVEYARTEDSISYTMAGWYADAPDSSNVGAVETFFSSQLSMSNPTVELREDDQMVVVEGTRPYTPPEERPETAGVPRFVEYDESTGEVLFRFERGEPLPVDRFEVEIDGEVYEGDWARGQERIGEGDTIAIDADAIEPGDDFSISYEAPDGSYGSASGTSALRNLPFDVDFDPDERTATISYVEGPPLQADRVSVVVDEGRTLQPWSGDLTEGDSATLSDLPLEASLVLEYERSDGETVRIGYGHLGPPGRFRFDYDGAAETLTVRYPDLDAERGDRRRRMTSRVPDQEPLDAGRYEITVDGEPANRQWADAGEEIAPGDTLALQGVPVDTEVSVAWIAADGLRHEVATTHTVPDVSFEFEYDAEAGELTIRHAGGQPVDPDALTVRLHGEAERTVDWTADGEVTEGDEFVIEDVPEHGVAVVNYRERHLTHVNFAELRSEE